ncbi:hypothetical protein GCM10010329_63160 [Streptomyces spiroverticillatus]|nr:hypothetical protein GCM10010329_63160 [Streptomyces spiroverticillatus]
MGDVGVDVEEPVRRRGRRSRHQERDEAIREQYVSGQTMQEVADAYGLTRQRVQQILEQAGTDIHRARQVRQDAKAEQQAQEIGEFIAGHGATVARLASTGMSAGETAERFALFLPAIPAGLVREGIAACGVPFDSDIQEFKFSPLVIEAAVWYVLGRILGLSGDDGRALAEYDLSEAREVAEVLTGAGLSTASVAEVLVLAHAARLHVEAHPDTGLSAQNYDAMRKTVLADLGLTEHSKKGGAPWPPTSQTVRKRLGQGLWAEVLARLGLQRDTRGRQPGGVLFDREDYLTAMADFLAHCTATSQPSSNDVYAAWITGEERAGRNRPSPQAVRLEFRSWTAAKRAGLARTAAAAASTPAPSVPRRSNATAASLSKVALHHAQQELAAGLEELATVRLVETGPLIERFVRTYYEEFEFRRRGWLRSAVEREPGQDAVTRRLANPDCKGKERKALEARPDRPGDVLTDAYIDKLGNGDPRDTGHWLHPAAQAELDALPDEVAQRFRVLKEARNLLTHDSTESALRLRTAVDALAALTPTDPLLLIRQTGPLSRRQLLSWLRAANFQRLQLLASSVPQLWQAMVTGDMAVSD